MGKSREFILAFGPNRPYGVGNQVVLRSGDDTYVLLGHLANGSVRATVGQRVNTGDAIARVGNSGWTERPRLHMQAMRRAAGDWWHGEPVPCTFGGRFLAKNQSFRTASRDRARDADE